MCRKTHRRRANRNKPFLAGALLSACLLLGVTQALERQPPQSPASSPPAQTTPSVQSTSPPEPSPTPEADLWNLTLVNPWTPLPEDYQVTLTALKNGHSVDERCYPDLQAMMDACRAAGLHPVICSSYRTWEKQTRLYSNQVDKLLARGYSRADAEAEAGRSVAIPGTSEHQLGLAVDIVDLHNQNLNAGQADTPAQKWLMEHCWEYGFILRYPSDKSELTGIVYEPWHYRYVGREAAQAIRDQDLCLEEYLAIV